MWIKCLNLMKTLRMHCCEWQSPIWWQLSHSDDISTRAKSFSEGSSSRDASLFFFFVMILWGKNINAYLSPDENDLLLTSRDFSLTKINQVKIWLLLKTNPQWTLFRVWILQSAFYTTPWICWRSFPNLYGNNFCIYIIKNNCP